MKIVFIDDENTGCYYVRTKVYADELKRLGHEVLVANGKDMPDNLLDYDVFCFNRTGEGNFTLAFDYLRMNGKVISYDTDDAIELVEPTNVVYHQARSLLQNYYYMLNETHVITTTTETLGNTLATHTPRPIYVFPNCINVDEWKERPKENKKLRIGFAGSNSHISDVIPMIEGIIQLQEEIDFDFYMFGMSMNHSTLKDWANENYNKIQNPKHPFYKAMLELEAKCKKIKNFHWIQAVKIGEYRYKLSELDFDIGLAPVLDTKFNRNKSELKLLEYAMVGTPCIGSNNKPYTGTPTVLVENNPKAWYNGIKELAINKELREKIAQEQKDWVLKNRDIKLWGHQRIKLYESLINDKAII